MALPLPRLMSDAFLCQPWVFCFAVVRRSVLLDDKIFTKPPRQRALSEDPWGLFGGRKKMARMAHPAERHRFPNHYYDGRARLLFSSQNCCLRRSKKGSLTPLCRPPGARAGTSINILPINTRCDEIRFLLCCSAALPASFA